MSKKTNVKELISLIVPGCRKQTTISKLILSILELKEKLSNPQEQSFFFRQGIQSNIERLNDMKKDYEAYRKEFNAMSIDQCLYEISDCRDIMYKARNMTPLFCRRFLFLAKRGRISRLEGYIQLKSVIHNLSAFNKLKSDKDLLKNLLRGV